MSAAERLLNLTCTAPSAHDPDEPKVLGEVVFGLLESPHVLLELRKTT
jgi:hypothetical protein